MPKLYELDGTKKEIEFLDLYRNTATNFFMLVEPETFIRAPRSRIFFGVPHMHQGSMANDGGNLIIKARDYAEFIKSEPAAQKWIRRFVGAREFINNLPRYCLWLVDCPPHELRKMPRVMERVENCREHRLKSKAVATRKSAMTPWLFCQIKQPKTNYLLVPRVSSERREYIPIGYMEPDIVASDAVLIIPDAGLWHFGVLTSLPHMIWTKFTCGRLETDYRYSAEIVYNNFPFPAFNPKVEETAQRILDVRKNYPEASFADLYDPVLMPNDLRAAHKANDRAVMEAYCFKRDIDEREMFKQFLLMYKTLVDWVDK